jgi:chorismate mutase
MEMMILEMSLRTSLEMKVTGGLLVSCIRYLITSEIQEIEEGQE